MLELLLRYFPDDRHINCRTTESGYTPLFVAASMSNVTAIEILRNHARRNKIELLLNVPHQGNYALDVVGSQAIIALRDGAVSARDRDLVRRNAVRCCNLLGKMGADFGGLESEGIRIA